MSVPSLGIHQGQFNAVESDTHYDTFTLEFFKSLWKRFNDFRTANKYVGGPQEREDIRITMF